MDCSLPRSSIHGIFQARVLERNRRVLGTRALPFPSPGDLPNPGIKPRSPTLQADSLPAELSGKPTLANPHGPPPTVSFLCFWHIVALYQPLPLPPGFLSHQEHWCFKITSPFPLPTSPPDILPCHSESLAHRSL